MEKEKKKNNKKVLVIFLIIILLVVLSVVLWFLYDKSVSEKLKQNDKELYNEIVKHYNSYVKTNKEAILYNEEYQEVGKIGNNVQLTLNDMPIDKDTKYFGIEDLDGYYIKYQDVDIIDELSEVDSRYKSYIPYNKNVVTNDKTSFYDEEGNIVYEFNKSFDLPIIINDSDNYGVEYNNRLLYIKGANVKEIKENHNTDKTNASGVGVLNYHAFYDETDPEATANCNTAICHSKAQFRTHLEYFKENNILTLKMKEVEMYIDGKIQLPKSVLITIDDGGREQDGIDLLDEYKMYATIFLITSWYNPSEYSKTDYIEFHSHTHDMHNSGDCPTGQGGGIQCLSEEKIQNDLRASREVLNNTTYFCYPFYEYNEYSIRMLKEAGFTMAFIGEDSYGDNLVHVGSDKFRLRRFIIVTYTTMNDLDNYFGQIR